ncbi:BTAD domain-containing putative transcriptional regulator [Actinacidiphila bryophytorum]|uniref:BTAD domain-containing putative transcriptional regulator n=1 Tax=Actinacidiphila bryophytorum TaxID=1436133 RepID=UPI002176CD86|nr:BTAD domain-containing putative transcriptional regulator [Actinacidiphila bryophytorum]UWE07664.1 winged helix-turn-helix domain-containing protein [Actinacidiphila bryophytorum]
MRGRVVAHLAGEQAAPLALVVAPAGYGKSILLAQHAAAFTGQVLTWRPHRGAHEPASLLNRVTRQLLGTGPGLGPEVGPWESAEPTTVESVLAAIEQRPNPVLLIVDDAHLIHGSPVEAALEEMALLAPANLRIVLAGRRRPAINLARHELSGAVVLTPLELALDAAEMREVLRVSAPDGAERAGGDAGRAEALVRLTEGWPVALRLCAQSPRRTGRSVAALADSTLAVAAVRGYLDREVLGVLPAALARDFERICRASPGRWLHDDGSGALDELDTAYGLVRRRADGRYDCVPLLREHVRRRAAPVPAVAPGPTLLPPDGGPPPALHLRCFRRFEAAFGEQELDWSVTRPRVRALARLLAVHAGQPVHRERLMAALWPESPERTASRGLQVALSALRTFLEPGADRGRTRLLIRSGEAYMIALPPGGSCDVQRFEAAVTTGLRAAAHGAGGAEQAAESLGLALRLYTGELLPEDGPAEWVVPLREHYRSQAVRAAHTLAEVELSRGRPAAAAAAAGAGLSVDPFQDAVWRLLVTAHRAAGDPAAAHQASLRHARVLATLDVPPRGLTEV